MADFTFQVGTHKTIVPVITTKDGSNAAPEGSVFNWMSSDPTVVEVTDAAAPSPEVIATGPGVVTITGTMDENGFHWEKTHTVEAVAAPEDQVTGFDFTIQ